MGFYGFSFVGSPLPVSRGETGESCCERRTGELGFTDFILPAVRFQFRGAKLARIVEIGGLRKLGATDLILSAVRFHFREAKLEELL